MMIRRVNLFRLAWAALLTFLSLSVHAQAVGAEYKLGSGDTLRVTVFQNPDLTLETRITEAGVISYPLIGSVRIGGMTVSQAEQAIADGLRKGNFVKQPQVSIAVMQVRGSQANVLGQVNRPGRYPIEVGKMKLTDMLATAGGVAPTGGDLVVITGTRNGKPFRAEVDLPSAFSPASGAQDVLIQNGDEIWVDRAPQVFIYGEVQRPGAIRLERGMTVMQALAAGGGLTQRGTQRGIRVHRGTGDKLEVLQPAMNDRLENGDVIYVRESLF